MVIEYLTEDTWLKYKYIKYIVYIIMTFNIRIKYKYR